MHNIYIPSSPVPTWTDTSAQSSNADWT